MLILDLLRQLIQQVFIVTVAARPAHGKLCARQQVNSVSHSHKVCRRQFLNYLHDGHGGLISLEHG